MAGATTRSAVPIPVERIPVIDAVEFRDSATNLCRTGGGRLAALFALPPDVFAVIAVDDSANEPPHPAPVKKEAPFAELPGRWVGEGRIGMTEGKMESVKCRATYFVNGTGNELKQNIRCASAGGKVEVKSNVIAKDGKLSGTWNELVYNLGGDMTGDFVGRRIASLLAGRDEDVLGIGHQVVHRLDGDDGQLCLGRLGGHGQADHGGQCDKRSSRVS